MDSFRRLLSLGFDRAYTQESIRLLSGWKISQNLTDFKASFVDPDNMLQRRLFHLDQYFIIFSAFMFLKSKGIN